MKIAVEGCCHGELDTIYATLQSIEESQGFKVDLLIVCGDFQCMRNQVDLNVLACPQRYRQMGTFYQYYSGQKKVPLPTIFIGGNHEASNYLWELFHGGWVAPNMYFLGYAGVIEFGGVRIGGLSGIYKSGDYTKGYYERQPFTGNNTRSIFHVRKFTVDKLKLIEKPIDIFVSHDWPLGISYYGDTSALLRAKPDFAEEVRTNTLGSPPGWELMLHLKPKYWFSAHLHIKFAALYRHRNGSETKFLSLDKCLPRRDFLQIFDFEGGDASLGWKYDQEWCSIVKATNQMISFKDRAIPFPRDIIHQVKNAEAWLRDHVKDWKIPENFVQTAKPHDPKVKMTNQEKSQAEQGYLNPQLLDFANMLGITNKINPHCQPPEP